LPEFLVERYEIGRSAAEAGAAAERLSSAAEALRAGGAELTLLGSRFVPADEASLTLFSAPSAALVEAVHRHADVPFERIVETIPLGAPAPPA
jgi:hypothetical protein